MRVLNNNLADGATLSTPDTISAGVITNLQDDLLGRKLIFSGATAHIVIDLGSAQNVTAIAIADHNLGPAAGDTWAIEANATDLWIAPSFTAAAVRGWAGRIGIQYLNQTYRYWRITLSATAAAQIGRIYAGTYIQSPRGIAKDFKWTLDRGNVRVITPGGQIRSSSGGTTRKTIAQIKGAVPDQLQSFLDGIPVGICFIDLIEASRTRGVDSRAFGDAINLGMTERGNFAADANLEVTSMLAPAYISDGPASDIIDPFYDVVPTLVINDVSQAEGDTGSAYAVFTVSLSHAYYLAVQFDYTTVDGTATTANNDYTLTAALAATIASGSTAFTINVPIIGDTNLETNEAFTVVLSNPVNATIADSSGLGTITNDDALTYPLRALFDRADTGFLTNNMDLETNTVPATGSVTDGSMLLGSAGTHEIFSNQLKCVGNGAAWSTGYASPVAITRAIGVAMFWQGQLSTSITHAMRGGFATDSNVALTGVEAELGIFGSKMLMMAAADYNLDIATPTTALWDFAIVLGGFDVTGVPYKTGDTKANFPYGCVTFSKPAADTDWKCLFAMPGGNSATLYSKIVTYNANPLLLDSVRIADYDLSEALVPTDRLDSPAAATAFNTTADGTLTVKISTMPSAGDLDIDVRRVSGSSYWRVRVTAAGAVQLVDDLGTVRATATGTAAVNSVVSAVFEGANCYLYLNYAGKATYGAVTLTATAGQVTSLGTSGALLFVAWHPRTDAATNALFAVV